MGADVSVWNALFWGLFSSASLLIGQALAPRLANNERLIGQIMGFGAGAMISAIAYDLIPLSIAEQGFEIGVAFLVGALVYYFADRWADSRGGAERQSIDAPTQGSGSAMFIGALLDGIPEAFVLGISLSLGGEISLAFVAAIFVSNIPQGIAGTLSLEAVGTPSRSVLNMWLALTAASGLVAAGGYLIADSVPDQGFMVEAFAAGAVLTMLADSMMPEAFEHGGKTVGLLTVIGFLIAATLTVMQG
jgi:ZIP family zinc transporter